MSREEAERRLVPFSGFRVRREDITRSRPQLTKIEQLKDTDRQFIATLVIQKLR